MATVREHLDQHRQNSQQTKEELSNLNKDLETAKAHLMNLMAREAQYKNIYQNAANNKESLQRRLKRTDEEEVQAQKQIKAAQLVESQAGSRLNALKRDIETLNTQIAETRKQLDENAADLAAQVNFVTLDSEGYILDRRAGGLSADLSRRLCHKIRDGVRLEFKGELFLESVEGHRGVLVLRGPGLSDAVSDTDPREIGLPPAEAVAQSSEGERCARLIRSFLDQTNRLLAGEQPVNGLLLSGFL